jgi:hypothetical protein
MKLTMRVGTPGEFLKGYLFYGPDYANYLGPVSVCFAEFRRATLLGYVLLAIAGALWNWAAMEFYGRDFNKLTPIVEIIWRVTGVTGNKATGIPTNRFRLSGLSPYPQGHPQGHSQCSHRAAPGLFWEFSRLRFPPSMTQICPWLTI